METILELSKFNNVKYYDGPHKYYIGDQQLTSATKFIGTFKPKFETEKIASRYAKKNGLDIKDVLNEWDLKRDKSTVKGSAVHDYAENWWNNKEFPYNSSVAVKEFGHDIIKDPFEKCKDIFLKFYNDSRKNLIPVKMELVVGDEEYGLGGMVDCLFFNKKSGNLEIWDYKTNKKISDKNSYGEKFKSPISHLDVCEINTYSLQLSLYKHLIEKNTNLKLGNSYLIWINEKNENYKIYKCKDLSAEIKIMIENFTSKT
jgi:ATP-dependent exoDNAse (exonuclease V) beta subunit